jgi:2-amino-4-hydroxy-6-hydroxymethyldihydropteridine diphosphokinase
MVVCGCGAVNAEGFVAIALGSNLGDREALLQLARREFRIRGFPWTLASPVHETAPVGGPAGQSPFLNQVIAGPAGAVTLEPEALLEVCLAIERLAGRERRERWGPRTLDADILLFGRRQVERPGLSVPHPRMAERRFVLEPLAAILPGLVHPVLGETFATLLARLPDGGLAGV